MSREVLPLPLQLPRRPPRIAPATDLAGVVALRRGDLMLLTDPGGDIRLDGRGLGLYLGDTRVLSRYELRLDGERPVTLRSGGGADADTIQCTNPDLPGGEGGPGATLRRESLGVRRERALSGGLPARGLPGSFHERVSVRNFTTDGVRCRLSVALEADDADIFEVRGLRREARGTWLPVLLDGRRVVFRYLGRDGVLRRTHVVFSEPYAVPEGVATAAASLGAREGPSADRGAGLETDSDGPLLVFDWRLGQGEERALEVTVWPEEEAHGGPALGARSSAAPGDETSTRRAVSEHEAAPLGPGELDELRRPLPPLERGGSTRDAGAWEAAATRVVAEDPFLQRALDRAAQDMRMLTSEGPEPGERYVAAGVPWYATLFGRDAIITAYELLPVYPELAAGTLRILARLQSTVDDPRRDAEPGGILHEVRTGELARAGEIPHTPYYGTVDATPLWLILLGETYAWTADRDLVESLWPNVRAALGWIDARSAQRPDGFLAYRRRSTGGEASQGFGGLPSQGWKDSWDSARMRDGRLATGAVALSEVQGYVHAARLAVAQLAGVVGDEPLRERQERLAGELRARFEAAYWMEDAGTYALGLDGEGRQVDAVASNAGQVLWGGIAAPERAARVAACLVGPGMWSGWGIRTLSSETAGYNPIGYHTGSVWPHDNALIAAGLARYGHAEPAARIAGALLGAARHFPDDRLPELFCGFGRDEAPLPVPYPVACSPQAWSAGSPFLFVGTLLGLTADAPAGRLELRRPYLPAWLPGVRLEGLRVGRATVDLRVSGSGSDVGLEVLRGDGTLDVAFAR